MKIVANPAVVSTSVNSHAERGETVQERFSVDVGVKDAALRAEIGAGFDGLERVYARLPRFDHGALKHEVVEVPYRATRGDTDLFTAMLSPSVDANAIRQHGVSFFLETNVPDGHIELQRYGENKFPRGAFGPV